jgi:hypothetical protein
MEKFIFPLHILTLFFVAITIGRADHTGFNWILGKVARLNEKKVKQLHIHTWVGLTLMIVTGFFLFLPESSYLLGRWQFYLKMAFVITLICNGLLISRFQKIAVTREFKSLTESEKLPLFVSGAVSTIAWLGAFVMAFFINGF